MMKIQVMRTVPKDGLSLRSEWSLDSVRCELTRQRPRRVSACVERSSRRTVLKKLVQS